MGACISRTEEGKNGDVLQQNGSAEEVGSLTVAVL